MAQLIARSMCVDAHSEHNVLIINCIAHARLYLFGQCVVFKNLNFLTAKTNSSSSPEVFR